METPWRTDPALVDKLHPFYPDDLQVLVHDGEPRRTGRRPELCWARIVGHLMGPERRVLASDESAPPRDPLPRTVYTGELLNQPHNLTTIHRGDAIRFYASAGCEHPLMVTQAYLAARAEWSIEPCRGCGLCEGLDPPPVMAGTRFPGAEATPFMFSSHCPLCGGTQLLRCGDGPR